jgi:thioredoxin-dependent peroxiredoxin
MVSRLAVGQKAPSLQGTSALGAPLSLEMYRGHKVWVAFFRYTSCTFCSLRIHEMLHRAERWTEAGLRIIGVFQSPVDAVSEFVRERRVPFPFACDPEERLYAAWGLDASVSAMLGTHLIVGMSRDVLSGRAFKKHGTLTRIPADFLIDERGVIADAFYGHDIADHIPFPRIDAFLERKSRI